MTAQPILPIAFALLVATAFSCASGPKKAARAANDDASGNQSSDASSDKDAASDQEAPRNEPATCADAACESNDECCKGYNCGFDPERSHVQRYCLAQ